MFDSAGTSKHNWDVPVSNLSVLEVLMKAALFRNAGTFENMKLLSQYSVSWTAILPTSGEQPGDCVSTSLMSYDVH